MEKLFQKGVVVDLSNLVDYSAGGVVSKQIVKSAAGIPHLLMLWYKYWKVKWKSLSMEIIPG